MKLPKDIAAERCRDGHDQLVLNVETDTIRTDQQALALHASLKDALAQLESSIYTRRRELKKQSDFRSLLAVDPQLKQRQLVANMLADHLVGKMTVDEICRDERYRHSDGKKFYHRKAVRRMIREALDILGISDPQKQVLVIPSQRLA